MHVEGREYKVVAATDVDRDAMQWECYLVDGSREKLVFEIVRFDGKREWSFFQYVESIPLAVVEYAVQHARADLGPFFNNFGTRSCLLPHLLHFNEVDQGKYDTGPS